MKSLEDRSGPPNSARRRLIESACSRVLALVDGWEPTLDDRTKRLVARAFVGGWMNGEDPALHPIPEDAGHGRRAIISVVMRAADDERLYQVLDHETVERLGETPMAVVVRYGRGKRLMEVTPTEEARRAYDAAVDEAAAFNPKQGQLWTANWYGEEETVVLGERVHDGFRVVATSAGGMPFVSDQHLLRLIEDPGVDWRPAHLIPEDCYAS